MKYQKSFTKKFSLIKNKHLQNRAKENQHPLQKMAAALAQYTK